MRSGCEKRRLITLCNNLKGSLSQVRVKQHDEGVASRCTRGDLGWILERISSVRVVKHWNGLPGEGVETAPPEIFKGLADMALQDMV